MKIKNKIGNSAIILAIVFFACSAFAQNAPANNESEEFDFANGLFVRGMYDMAAQEYEGFLKTYPSSQYAELAEFRISESYFLLNDHNRAMESFKSFLAENPASEMADKAELRIGQIYYFNGDLDTAQSVLEKVIAGGSRADIRIAAQYYVAVICSKKGETEKARNILEELLKETNEGKYLPFAYLSLGDIYSGMKEYTKAARSYREASAKAGGKNEIAFQAAYRAAGAYHRAGDAENARVFYQKVIDEGPLGGMLDSSAVGLVNTMYRTGRYEDVIASARDLVMRVTDDKAKAKILFLLGNSYFYSGNLPEAEKVLDEVSDKYPGTKYGIKAKLNACWVLFDMGEYDQCVQAADGYLVNAKGNVDEILYIKAKALMETGDAAGAFKTFEELINDHKNSGFRKDALYEAAWLYQDQGERDKAIGHYARFIQEYQNDPRVPSAFLKAGQENLKLGRYDEAERLYKRFLSLFPDHSLSENAMYQLGRVYVESGNNYAIIKTYEKFVKDFPGSEAVDPALYRIGESYQQNKEWDKAIESYSKLTKKKTGDFYQRGLEASAYAYFQKGDYSSAASMYYELVTSSNGLDVPEGVYRWTAGYYLGEEENNRSITVLKEYQKAYPSSSEGGDIYYLYGENYGDLGNWDTAREYFKKALSKGIKSPQRERAYLGIGRSYLAKNEFGDALSALEEALKDHKDNITGAFARFEIGNIRDKMGEYEEAAKQYLMVAILYDDEDLCSQALFRAGVAFRKAGKMKKAIEVFKELKQKYPSNPLSAKVSEEIRLTESEKD